VWEPTVSAKEKISTSEILKKKVDVLMGTKISTSFRNYPKAEKITKKNTTNRDLHTVTLE
jgi:hypothetical protein